MSVRHTLVLACCISALVDCGGSQKQAESQAELAAISAGCKVSLDLEHGLGEAGAADDTERGCKAALGAWEHAK